MNALRVLRYMFFLGTVVLYTVTASAQLDNGTDENGKLVLSETLARRCGIGSKNPAVDDECIKRLVFDYKTNNVVGFGDFSNEKSAIINDYSKAYFDEAVNQMIANGTYGERIDKLLNESPTGGSVPNNDIRETIEKNNKLMSNHSSLMIDTIGMRSSSIIIDNTSYLLNNIVPRLKDIIDVEKDKEYALPPSGTGGLGL